MPALFGLGDSQIRGRENSLKALESQSGCGWRFRAPDRERDRLVNDRWIAKFHVSQRTRNFFSRHFRRGNGR